MLNRNLNELKKIFDGVESYNINQNIGFRSLKNIGVWLSIYALTSDNDKVKVIKELAQKANIPLENIDEVINITKLADYLIQPENLTEVIGGYEKANGHFTLTVNNEINLNNLVNKIKEKKYESVLLKHVQINTEQEADIVFLMNNAIKFNWAANSYLNNEAEYKTTNDKFCGEKMAFLEANDDDHLVRYGIIEHNQRLYHVVLLGTLQKKEEKEEAKRTNTFLIESIDANDAIYLQKDYFEIIEQIKNNKFQDENTYHILQKNKQAALNVKINGKLEKRRNQFNFTVRFPKILDTLTTTEERLGIYEQFVGKNIANLTITRIQYKGTRELTYDHKGGEIKNREEILCFKEFARATPNIIRIQYTAANAFMMIYEAENGADYYPYFIADPRKDLKMSFSADLKYPDQQKLIGFASTGRSLFSTVNNINVKNDFVIEEKPTGLVKKS